MFYILCHFYEHFVQVLRFQVPYKCMRTSNLHVNYLEMDLSCLIRNAEISRGNIEIYKIIYPMWRTGQKLKQVFTFTLKKKPTPKIKLLN